MDTLSSFLSQQCADMCRCGYAHQARFLVGCAACKQNIGEIFLFGGHRYNTVMKLVFLGTSFSIIYFMRFHRVVRNTYDKEQDTFRVMFIIIPCAVLALLINQERSALEVGDASFLHQTLQSPSFNLLCGGGGTSGSREAPWASMLSWCYARKFKCVAEGKGYFFHVICMLRSSITIFLFPRANKMLCCDLSQILWTFSIYLEAVAILPQLVLLQRTQNIDNLTGNYVFLLG